MDISQQLFYVMWFHATKNIFQYRLAMTKTNPMPLFLPLSGSRRNMMLQKPYHTNSFS